MRLRQTEAEIPTGASYNRPRPGSESGRYDQVEQGAATGAVNETMNGPTVQRGHSETERLHDLATTAVPSASRFDIREALFVTLWAFLWGLLLIGVTESLIAATSGKLMPFPVTSGTIRQAISFAVLVLHVAVVGSVVGMLANRRTMTASIVAANLVGLLVAALVFLYLYMTLPPEAWAASTIPTFGILFKAVTMTVTDIVVAHYVARKFRKKP